jgi:hypothetical protein
VVSAAIGPRAWRIGRRLAIGTTLALAGCNDAISPEAERLAAQERWERQRLVDYAFEYRADCFCTAHVTRWHRIEVRGGRVTRATPVEPLPDLAGPAPPLEFRPTVAQLFALAATPPQGEVVAITARFDPERGYPTEVAIRCSDRIADCGVTHVARALVPLTP